MRSEQRVGGKGCVTVLGTLVYEDKRNVFLKKPTFELKSYILSIFEAKTVV